MMKRICRLFFLIIAFCLFINVASATISISGDTTVISEQAFYGDASITDVDLPEGLLRIEKQAFAYTSLSSVALPFSLEYFAPDAFEGCPEGLMLRVYPGSNALRLCLEYQIPHEIIGSTSAAVGISMPTKDLQRWAQDGENMENQLRDSGFEVELQYAGNDYPTQLNQIETMIDHGCKVIVIAPINGHLLGTALAKAKAKGIKIIAYDRLLMDSDAVDYYVTFDNYMVGTVQGTYVKEELDLDNAIGPFYMEITAGDPGDNNARSFYQGAIDVLKPYIDAGKIIVRSGQTGFNQVATPTWQTSVAQKRAEDILNGYYANGEQLDAWLCSNDSTALGVTNALDNYTGEGWPIITGQDCDIVNVKNIIAGKQSMSVFKDTRTLAAQAVKMITQILAGGEVEVNDTETYNNNVINVPSFLCAPVYADAGNYNELLIDSGYYTEDQLGGGSSIPGPLPTGDSGNLIKVGIIHLDPAESGYREANVKDMMATFTAENGYEASFATASTPERQLNAARSFIADGVKYILVSAADADGWDEVLQEAKDAGIGVFLFDRMVNADPSLYTAAVVSDMAKEGETAVAWLESLGLEEYKILHIKGGLGTAAQIGRSGPLEEKCEANNNWTIVREGTGGYSWDPEEARKITQAAINAGEDFNIIYAENDGMANGAAIALEAAGIAYGVDHGVIIMGFDCNKWALRKLLAGEWNYDGQCSPFQAAPIDRMIKKLEAGESIEGLNELNQYINEEIGFDARTITEADVNRYGLGE